MLASIALTFSPGPDIIYVLVQSITNSKKHGIVTALGLVSGIIIHTTLVAFGISALINQSPVIFYGIKVFGALYLLYLAYKVYKTDTAIIIDDSGTNKKELLQLFKQGFIMNVLNPKVTLFFFSFLPAFLFSSELNKVTQFYVLGILFMIQALAVFSSVAILSGTIATAIKKNESIGIWLKWIQIVVFLGIAIFLLF